MKVDDSLTEAEVARIAEEAYLYLYPLVTMDITRRVAGNVPAGQRPGFGPMNHFNHTRAFPPGDFKEVVRPNFDTLYSPLWFDVRDEPLVISTPDTAGRYYMLPMLDMWTDVFAVPGSRTTGTGEGRYALVGPRWAGELPAEVQRVDAPTPFGWILCRIQTNGVADYGAVNALQDGFVATPLSRWPAEPAAVEFSPDPEVDMGTKPLEQVESMAGIEFMTYGLSRMALHPPHLIDQPMLARMSRIRLRPGEPLRSADLDARVNAAVEQAPASAQQRMTAAAAGLWPLVNGWSQPTSGIGVYGTDYLRRATVARMGLGANPPEDAIYPVCYLDESGDVPNGEHSYVLHFDAGALPPADAFWSVTMYDVEGFPAPNAIERYAIGDRDPLRPNLDGSLDLYLQHEDPGDERRDNWLPAPRGKLGVTLRIYGPRPEALDGSWVVPPLRRA